MNRSRKVYLKPPIIRKHKEIIQYVVKDGKRFMLGSRLNLHLIDSSFSKREQFTIETVCSEEFYAAFVKESRKNAQKYRPQGEPLTDEEFLVHCAQKGLLQEVIAQARKEGRPVSTRVLSIAKQHIKEKSRGRKAHK